METQAPDLKSPTFCMAPWVHLHTWPDGSVYPCCLTPMENRVGDLKKESLTDIWNGKEMRELRLRMLKGEKSPQCVRCYELQDAGSMNLRMDLNRDYGHHIDRVRSTRRDGFVETVELNYFDFRFSNLCNLKCRTCGPQLSSSWYDDHVKLFGPEALSVSRKVIRPNEDPEVFWKQVEPHLDRVEEIYFAGGEPLIMAEHYRILKSLIDRGRFEVRLKYNTNFSKLRHGSEDVLEYWKKFKHVKVLASLDGEGRRGELLRKGQDWVGTVKNREAMLRTCPDVDFRIGPTVSAMNVWHLPDFHRSWVEKGLIRPADITLNLLIEPKYYQIRVLPQAFKDEIILKYTKHLEWITTQFGTAGDLAVSGFRSVLQFMTNENLSDLWPEFVERTRKLDSIRGEKFTEVFPELNKYL